MRLQAADMPEFAFRYLADAFAAPGEVPEGLLYSDKCERNFEIIQSLMKKGLATGVLDKRFDSRELAYGFYGQLNSYQVSHLLMPDCPLDRRTAKRIVELFLAGAAAKKPSSGSALKEPVKNNGI